jgi:glycosyltransferase involved in cell wall biosynthesis
MLRSRAKFIEPLVSVVLPVRDGASTLRAAIRSICHQTLSDWELVVVDDGSTDGSAEVAASMAVPDQRIKVIRQARAGLVPALEAGLQEARGRYIARMDADDISYPDRLASQVDLLEWNSDIGLVGGQVEYGGDANANAGYALHVDWINSLVKPEEILLNRFIESPLAHPSVMFRRDLVDRHDGYRDGPFPEDYELWLRWLDAGVVMTKVPKRVLIWNDSPERLSRTDKRYDSEAFYAIKAGYLARAVKPVLKNRQLWIWGAGRPTRKRAEALAKHGLKIHGYIDIDAKKSRASLNGRPVVLPEQIPPPHQALVLGYVAKRGARELIRENLEQRGYFEGRDFYMAA